MSRPALAVSHPVIRDVVRRAALEVPGVLRVGRAGPPGAASLVGRPVAIRLRDGVGGGARRRRRPARRSRSPRSPPTCAARSAAAIERLLGLELGAVTVVVDGVGA